MKTGIILLAGIGLLFAGEIKLGKPLTLAEPQPIAAVVAASAELEGKVVQVKGKITEVCEKMGCWMQLVDPRTKASLRIKVSDGEIVFPKTAIGKIAIAEGPLKKIEMSRVNAVTYLKHEAEEKGAKFDPASVKGPLTIWQVQGTGAVILD